MISPTSTGRQPDVVHLPFAIDLGIPWINGFIDRIHVEVNGLIRLVAWTKHRFLHTSDLPLISVDHTNVPVLNSFRVHRKDVCNVLQDDVIQPGVEILYLIPERLHGDASAKRLLELSVEGWTGIAVQFFDPIIVADYQYLFGSQEVFHRSDIYGSGPSNVQVAPEVFAMAAQLQPPILDFGCGRGALVRQLREHGIEAYGLELGSEERRQNIPGNIADFISFYDGSFPSPYIDGQFNSVVCSEVLEHIPRFEQAIADIGRLARHAALFTVPDASAIPILHRHKVVPWHLLEGTHVNFFNQRSLSRLLQKEFSDVRMGKMGLVHVNDSMFFVSLTAICNKERL